MSQPDSRSSDDTREKKRYDYGDEFPLFTIITATIALIVGIAWFVQMVIESFFKK